MVIIFYRHPENAANTENKNIFRRKAVLKYIGN